MTPAAEIKALVERLEEAMSRDGKPRGDHMIGPYAALAVASLESDEDGGVEMASVYDTASRCIANETAMFKTLSLSAAEAATALRSFMDGAWRPIETAPKDGTDVLIWNCEGAEIAHWAPKEEDGPDQPGYDEGWHGSYAWPGRSWGYRLQSLPQGQPTHWMPLPTPPAVEGEAGE